MAGGMQAAGLDDLKPKRARDSRSRFRASHDVDGLVDAVSEVIHFVNQETPGSVSTRRFDAARVAAGHPDLPTAKRISTRLKRSWAEVLKLVTDPSRSRAISTGAWLGAETGPGVAFTAERALYALRVISHRTGSKTFSRAQYEAEAEKIRTQASARGAKARFPNADQVRLSLGPGGSVLTWGEAMRAAGLRAQEGRSGRKRGMAYPEAISLFVDILGTLPCSHELPEFMCAQGLALGAGRAGPWRENVEEARRLRAERGLMTPGEPPLLKDRPDHQTAVTISKQAEQRTPRRYWSDQEMVEALAELLASHPAGRRLSVVDYKRISLRQRELPSASLISLRGGFTYMFDLARKHQRARDSAEQ